jgi:hypothetical protein
MNNKKKSRGINMKRFKFRVIWYIFLVFILMQTLTPYALAGEDASLDEDLAITATPPRQGSGGPIELTITATFFGGCCYALYAYDVIPLVDLPDDLVFDEEVSPKNIAKFEATAGGGAVLATFKCVIKSTEATPTGDYTIPIKVTTSNCGSSEAEITVTITEGCVISIPTIFPNKPSTDRSTILTFEAYSPIEDKTIEKVSLYYLKMDESKLKDATAKNETLSWSGNNVVGKEVAFERVQFEDDLWQGEIPRINEETTVAYWIVAEDNNGKTTTSTVSSIIVKDLDKVYLQHNILVTGVILFTVIGFIVTAAIWKYSAKFSLIKPRLKGVVLLGRGTVDMKSKVSDDKSAVKRMNLTRNIVLLTLFIIGIALIIVALNGGQYETLREYIGG